MTRDLRLDRIAPWLGLLGVCGYVIWILPLSIFVLGYIEDLGIAETTRQIMGENLLLNGGPVFRTESFMAPSGASVPFMSWSIEKNGLGGLNHATSPCFPFFWAYSTLSFVLTYFGVGFLLGRMGIPKFAAWIGALICVVLNVPRHYSTWHH